MVGSYRLAANTLVHVTCHHRVVDQTGDGSIVQAETQCVDGVSFQFVSLVDDNNLSRREKGLLQGQVVSQQRVI